MGSTDEETASVNIKPEHAQREKPRHKVTIARRFLAARHEVTRGQFKQFVQESGYKTEVGSPYTWDDLTAKMMTPEEVIKKNQPALNEFLKVRKKYLLY